MRMRLLTTAAALALFAAMTGPGSVLAAGETPTSNTGATVGTSTSTGGSLSEPVGVDSDATTPSVYAPAAPAGSGAGTAGTGSTPITPSGTAASGPLGTSTSPSLAPSGISTKRSGSSSSSFGKSASMGSSVPIDSTAGGPLTIGTQGLLLPPDYANGTRVFYRSDYIGAPYETSMGGTEHARRAMDGGLQGSRYEALAREIQANAGETRGMADRNGTLFDPSAEEFLDID